MKIQVYNKQKNLPIASQVVKKIVEAVITREKYVCDEVSVHFITSKKISELHDKYFDDPSITDCISFPMLDPKIDMGYKILGEIFVCPQTAIQYAQKHRCNPYEECTLYIVHGLLHLMGYDDLKPQERSKMRKAEKKHIDHLKKINLALK